MDAAAGIAPAAGGTAAGDTPAGGGAADGAAAAPTSTPMPVPAQPTRKTVLVFSPHQDDELLTLGAWAQRAIAQGCDGHVVLCADGAKSCVRGVLADGQTCDKHDGVHSYNLDEDAFSDARDREFLASCQAIGYRPSRVHFAPRRAVDGCLSEDQAREIIQWFLAVYPEAEVCTISPLVGDAQHRDHRCLGQAALGLYREGAIRKLNLFVEPYCLDAFRQNNPAVNLERVAAAADEDAACLSNAISQYCLWEPDQGRYAVGYHSVTGEFDAFMKEPASFWHSAEEAR